MNDQHQPYFDKDLQEFYEELNELEEEMTEIESEHEGWIPGYDY